jgi:hypothetical protein
MQAAVKDIGRLLSKLEDPNTINVWSDITSIRLCPTQQRIYLFISSFIIIVLTVPPYDYDKRNWKKIFGPEELNKMKEMLTGYHLS